MYLPVLNTFQASVTLSYVYNNTTDRRRHTIRCILNFQIISDQMRIMSAEPGEGEVNQIQNNKTDWEKAVRRQQYAV
jgi:hypothetical protein